VLGNPIVCRHCSVILDEYDARADAPAENEPMYDVDVLDLMHEIRGFAELSQIFAQRGWSFMAEHALQKAAGRLVHAAALLQMRAELDEPDSRRPPTADAQA
jgi:hypothetical protein